MESILKSTKIRRLQRGMLVLEGITFLTDDVLTIDNAKKKGIDEVAERFRDFINQVYRISHAALGDLHECHKHHEGWLIEIENLEKLLEHCQICKADRIFEEIDGRLGT